MKKTEPMATLPGLFQRNGVYQLRVMIPKDLQQAYGGRSKLVESLSTSDNQTAKLLGTALRAARLAEFDQKHRELKPQTVERMTPEMGQALAQRVYAAYLAHDDSLRGNPGTAQLLLRVVKATVPSQLTIGGQQRGSTTPLPAFLSTPVDPMEGLTRELAQELAALNEAMDTEAAIALATQQLKAVLPTAQAEASKLGLAFDPRTPGALDALRECLKAQRRARQDIVKRDQGAAIDTPQELPVDAAKPLTLRDVFDKWKTFERRGPDAISACERALGMFEQWSGMPQPPVGRITRAQGGEFKAWLLKKVEARELSSKTAHDRLTSVCGLLRHAFQELEVIERHAWRGLKIQYTTENPRRIWTHAELQVMAALPLFQSYALPERAWKAGGAAAYWVPLLGLYTGATVSELCQLQTNDVELEADGGALLHITNDVDAEKGLKGEARRRLVPVHSELIRLGFLDYVAATTAAGNASLWPQLKLRKGKPGGYFSTWFGTLRRSDGEKPLFPDFHSMRHTVRTKMTSAGFDVSIQDRVTGHTVKGSAGTRVYTHVEVPLLRRAVESISFPALAIPRAYKAD